MPSSCARKSISLCQGSSCVAAIWFEVFDSLSQGTHCEVAFIVLDESISLCLGSSWVAAIWFGAASEVLSTGRRARIPAVWCVNHEVLVLRCAMAGMCGRPMSAASKDLSADHRARVLAV